MPTPPKAFFWRIRTTATWRAIATVTRAPTSAGSECSKSPTTSSRPATMTIITIRHSSLPEPTSLHGTTGTPRTIGRPASTSAPTTHPTGGGTGVSIGVGAPAGDGIRDGVIRGGMTIGTAIRITPTVPTPIPAAGTATARTHRATRPPRAALRRAAASAPAPPHREAALLHP